MTNLRIAAPITAFGQSPRAVKRAHNACTSGLCCLATIAGKYNAARTAALPAFDSRVRRWILLRYRLRRGRVRLVRDHPWQVHGGPCVDRVPAFARRV